jgi:hypothetical protein
MVKLIKVQSCVGEKRSVTLELKLGTEAHAIE